MAINYELINKGGISLGTNFELLSEKPLDSRLVVPSLSGLQNYIDNAAAYEGMIVFDKNTKKTYQVQTIDGVLSYREFGLTEDELKNLIAAETTAAMEFKGATAALPENPSKGDMWKVAANFTIDEEEVKIGDSIVYNGEQWFIIPSGDDIEDTWRPVTDVSNDASLTFKAGAKLDVAVASNGDITYSHEEIADPELLASNEQTRTYITEVTTDGHGHITGYKTATENVVDTNTTYDFECAAEHSNVYFTVKEMNGEEVVATHTVCVDAYNKNEVNAELLKKANADDVKALIKEIYGGDAIVEASRIDTAVDNAAEALRVAGVAAGDAAEAKSAAQDAANAQTGAAASASAAATSAQEAADSAIEALGSQNAAATSASAASGSAESASASAGAASASAQAAAGSEANASGSANAAAQSASDASGSASAAAISAGEAADKAGEAADSAATAADKAGEAAGSATAAAGSAGAAAASAVTAGEKADAAAQAKNLAEAAANNAAASESNASKSAENADASADAALASQNAAAQSALTAEQQAGIATNKATAASESATAANTAKLAAEAAQGKAETAQNLAETAQGNAEVAQGKAEAAQAAAETAQSKAEAAQAAAEDAKAAALDSNTSATAIATSAKEIADKAVQDVTNVAGNGLILTKSADKKISVDWDSNVVFVFNCGSATTLID